MKKVGKNRDVLKEYDNAVEGIWSKFFIKHGWVDEKGIPCESDNVANDKRDYVLFADMVISLSDAIYDLENDIPNEMYEQWNEYSMEHIIKGYPLVKYPNYVNGFRNKERTKIQEFIYNFKNKVKHIVYCIFHAKERRKLRELIMKRLEDIQCN